MFDGLSEKELKLVEELKKGEMSMSEITRKIGFQLTETAMLHLENNGVLLYEYKNGKERSFGLTKVIEKWMKN